MTLRACLENVKERAGADQCVMKRVAAANRQLNVVDEVLGRLPTWREKWKGADIERAWVNLHEVKVTLLELTDPKDLRGELPHAYAVARRLLKPDSPELAHLIELVERDAGLDPVDRDVLATAMRTAHGVRAEQHRQVRSFRNTLLASAAVLIGFSVLIGIVGLLSPASVNLCFGSICPTGASTPSGGDMFVVELFGVFGAMIVGAVAIRRMHGTATPYAVPLASLLVKLPSGALTAVGGILLLRAGFVAGVEQLSTADIGAYAMLFGASQQAVTQLLDRQTQTVLNSVGATGAKESPQKTAR
jgi:hypothetical protein